MEASPDASLAATNRASREVVEADHRHSPRPKFMWSLTASWGGFGGMVAKDWKERTRSTEQMYGEVYGAVSQVPGLRVFPRLDPPLPDARPVRRRAGARRATRRPSRCSRRSGQVVGAGWQSGKFLYVDTDLKIDLPEARVVIDREQVADLGLDLAERRPGARAPCSAAATSTGSTSTTAATRSSRRSATRTAPRSGRCSTSRSRRRAASWCRCRRSRASRRAPRRGR